MKPSAIGTMADMAAAVDISKVVGGYFSNEENANSFIEIGIASLDSTLPKLVKAVDYGGGDGFLALRIKKYLESKGHRVNIVVAVGNDKYLKIAASRGLDVELCNLDESKFEDLDIGIMRSVNHYNSLNSQSKILKNVYKSIEIGGYLISQVSSSADSLNCALRSAIVNLSSLGRIGGGGYHWTDEKEYHGLLQKAGFGESRIAGYAPPASWTPEEQWERFNGSELTQSSLLRKKAFLTEAYDLISSYPAKYGSDVSGLSTEDGGAIRIWFTYPIFVSRK